MLANFVDIHAKLFNMKKGSGFTTMDNYKKCDVLWPWSTDYPGLVGMAVPKGSLYYEMLRYQTLRQMEMGTLQVNASLKHYTVAQENF
jgi:hypothetical protein